MNVTKKNTKFGMDLVYQRKIRYKDIQMEIERDI
jgi:hypothetical protein